MQAAASGAPSTDPGRPSQTRLQLRRSSRRRLRPVDRPAVELVIVPRSAEIQAAEEALSLALVAMVAGTRPPVTPAMVRDHLRTRFDIPDDAMLVQRHAPEDFIVRFSRLEDLERVLRSRPPSGGAAPFMLLWRRWSRLSAASGGSFSYKVLVGIKGIPAHARSQAVAAQLLGSSCAQVELATADAEGVDDDDARELFVAAWCLHPLLVPEQKLLVIPEPLEPHDPGILFLREDEIIHSELPILHYLAQMRVVEYQDWDPSSSSDDDDEFPGAVDSDDSGDSNFNGYHPGIDEGPSRSRPFGPTTVRQGGRNGPSLGRGSGPAFRPRRQVVSAGSAPSVDFWGAACSDTYRLIREGKSSLDGRAWSWCGKRRFGRAPRDVLLQSAAIHGPATACASGQAAQRTLSEEVLFHGKVDSQTYTLPREDRMLLEAAVGVCRLAADSFESVGSPDLAPSRSIQSRSARGFIAEAFDGSPGVRAGITGSPVSVSAQTAVELPVAASTQTAAGITLTSLPSNDVSNANDTENNDDSSAQGEPFGDDDAAQRMLEERICVPLRSPLIRSRPRLRRSRTPISVASLRRSARIAAKPRAPNTTKQAQLVLLRKLGVMVDQEAPEEDIERKFKETFRGSSMSSGKQMALQILFNSDFDPAVLGLDDVVEA